MKVKEMQRMKKFISDDRGSGTYVAVVCFIAGGMLTGLALDATNAHNEALQLQIAADAAALAAAANIDDTDRAIAVALETVRMNLGETDAITASDFVFGHVNTGSSEFVTGADADGLFSAVSVDGFRTLERDAEIPTFLVDMIGWNEFEATRLAIAGARMGGGGGALAGCEDASFISENKINTGGGINLSGAVCMHGKTGVLTGGGDTYSEEVRFSAETAANIVINNYRPSSLPVEQLKFARTLDPVILPQLSAMHNDLWTALSGKCNWTNADTAVDGTYSGDALPSFITKGGSANLVCMSNWKTFQPGELKPYTIYLSKSGVQFAGGVQQNNIAIISKGQIGVGGGPALAFDEVFFFGTQLNLAGNINWGPRNGACQHDKYSVYVFGLDSLSMGGWSAGPTLNNVVGASKAFRPGGAMAGTGMYFESKETIQLGGALNIKGCDTAYTSELEIAQTGIPKAEEASGSFLLR